MAIEKTVINGETVYLKKNKLLGWGVVNPMKNEDGTKNWPNILYGGKPGLIRLGITIAIVVMLAIGFNSQIAQCRDMAAHPCKYFSSSTVLQCEAQANQEYFAGWKLSNTSLNESLK